MSNESVPEGPDLVARRSRRRKLVAAFCILLGAGGVVVGVAAAASSDSPASASSAALRACEARVAGAKLLAVAPDQGLNQTWASYVASDQGWTGGDSVFAYDLPGDGTLYTFSDSFIGGDTDNHRAYKLIYHNLFVVKGTHGWRVVTSGTQSDPAPLVTAPWGKDFYEQLGGIVEGNDFQSIFMERLQTGTQSLDNVPVAYIIGTFSLPDLQLLRVAAVPDPLPDIQWGSYVQRFGSWTYIYGSSAWDQDKSGYVARVAGDSLLGRWSYWDGHGWSADPGSAAPIAHSVQPEFSVTAYHGVYVMLTSDGTPDFSPLATVSFGCSPVGPWERPATFRLSYSVGEQGETTWNDRNVYVYDAIVQPALGGDGRLVMSFNRNSLDFHAIFVKADIYGPTYLDLDISVGKGKPSG